MTLPECGYRGGSAGLTNSARNLAASRRRSNRLRAWTFAGIAATGALGIAWSLRMPPVDSVPAAAVTPTLAELEIEKNARIQSALQKAKEEREFYLTVGVLSTIKGALREPKSVEWTYIAASIDDGVVCVGYRARNGFGGMNSQNAVYAGQSIHVTPQAWLKYCSSSKLKSMWSARLAVK